MSFGAHSTIWVPFEKVDKAVSRIEMDINLIVWPAILERFCRAALGATLLRCTGKLQREESVIHIVSDRLDDMTPRLNTLRDRTGEAGSRPAPPKPPFISPAKPPGYDARAIVINSRDFR